MPVGTFHAFHAAWHLAPTATAAFAPSNWVHEVYHGFTTVGKVGFSIPSLHVPPKPGTVTPAWTYWKDYSKELSGGKTYNEKHV